MESDSQRTTSDEPVPKPKRKGIPRPMPPMQHNHVEESEKKWRFMLHNNQTNNHIPAFKKMIDNHEELDGALNLYKAGKLLGFDSGAGAAYIILSNKSKHNESRTLPLGLQIIFYDKTIEIPSRGWPAGEIPHVGNLWSEVLHIMMHLSESHAAFRRIIVGAFIKVQKDRYNFVRQRISLLLARQRNMGIFESFRQAIVDDYFMQTGVVIPSDDFPMTFETIKTSEEFEEE